MAFHWHGDTFDVPSGALNFAYSELTVHQGFIYGEKIIALQYHYEVDEQAVKDMVDNAGTDLDISGPYLQTASEILMRTDYTHQNNKIMFGILDYLEQKTLHV
ncbi:MAG: hypothetical protein HC906_02465 [Bacteroidales bacterium]|nr:hypothetical protein [Bacteroidales bacterium]